MKIARGQRVGPIPRHEQLADTELAKAQVNTIRLRLLKIGARVVWSVRRVVFHLASSYRLKICSCKFDFVPSQELAEYRSFDGGYVVEIAQRTQANPQALKQLFALFAG